MASWINIGSGIGFVPVLYQDMTWTDENIYVMNWSLRNKNVKFEPWYKYLLSRKHI